MEDVTFFHLEVIPTSSECLTILKRSSKAKKAKKGKKKGQKRQKGQNTIFIKREEKLKKFQRAGGKIHFLSRDRNISRNRFSSRYLKNFFGLFGLFLLEGLKDPFLVQKVGGTFFLGGVKKHELGVGNYR